jgi:OTU domain-containing protein 3
MAKGKRKGTKQTQKRSKLTPRQRHQQPPRNNTKRTRNTSSTNAAKIEEYMTSHGIIRKPIIGDGNCLFRAMADQLGLSQDLHRQIRQKIINTIHRDKDYFVNFIDEDEVDGVEAYCEEMSKDGSFLCLELMAGVWGDDIELEAFRRAYERALVIYDASTGTPYIKPFNGDEGKSLSTVHLWKSDCHYESVRNKDGPFDGPSRVVYKVLYVWRG